MSDVINPNQSGVSSKKAKSNAFVHCKRSANMENTSRKIILEIVISMKLKVKNLYKTLVDDQQFLKTSYA
ncbi:7575_t:CDS:1, partial [Gigaspora margarita]